MKLTLFVDESGQDTEGRVFVVGIVLIEGEYVRVSDILEHIESETGKRTMKWNKAKPKFRKEYVERIVREESVRRSLSVEIFSDSGSYIELTALASARAILKKVGKSEYKATIFVDGLKGGERELFTRVLRDLRIRTRKIRGVKKDSNNAMIRLADALCGLVRDAEEGDEWASVQVGSIFGKNFLKKQKPPLKGE